jgi:hypothetical protein
VIKARERKKLSVYRVAGPRTCYVRKRLFGAHAGENLLDDVLLPCRHLVLTLYTKSKQTNENYEEHCSSYTNLKMKGMKSL